MNSTMKNIRIFTTISKSLLMIRYMIMAHVAIIATIHTSIISVHLRNSILEIRRKVSLYVLGISLQGSFNLYKQSIELYQKTLSDICTFYLQ